MAGAVFGEACPQVAHTVSWQFGAVQLSLFVAGAVLGEVAFKLHTQFSRQVQDLVKFNCHFSRQVQYLLKIEMIAGVRNAACFFRKCTWPARKVTSVVGRVVD